MEKYSEQLLNILSKICSDMKENTLSEKLMSLSRGKKDSNEQEFISSLKLIVNKNKLVSNLLGYQDIIYKNIVEIFKKRKYRNEEVFKIFIKEKDENFKKLIYISFLIGKKKQMNILKILFSIVNQDYFKLLNTLKITNLEDNEFFVFLIERNNINELEKEKEKTKKEIDINKFIEFNIDDMVNYYNSINQTLSKKKKIAVDNSNKNNNMNIINNNINANLNSEKNIIIINENNNTTNNDNINNNSININNTNDFVKEIENNTITINNINNLNISNENISINNIESEFGNNNNDTENNSNNNINNENNCIIINENNKITINEKINIKKKEEERINRIKKLINTSLLIDYNSRLQENSFLEFNYNKFKGINDKLEMKDILIDNYKSKENTKLHLFSPVSLVANNIKNNFQKNDFEIFNDDNYFIEMFGFYLKEIIDKLNSFINEGKEEDYINSNKIRFGCYHNHYYLCCQLNDKYKHENMIINNDKKDRIQIIQIKNHNKNIVNEKSKKENGKSNKELSINTNSDEKLGSKNYSNKISYEFEKEVSQFLFEKDCENLHNIIFFLNLKLPIINDEEEREFKSVRLLYSQYPNSLYGFGQIDICMINKNKRVIKKNNILCNNICFKYIDKNFKVKSEEEIEVSLEKDSIIFCEVKNSFTPIENSSKNQNDKFKDNNNIDNDNNIDKKKSLSYIEQIEILLKKAKIFYNFLMNEKIMDENKSMHILFL